MKNTKLPINKQSLSGFKTWFAAFFRPQGLMHPFLGKKYSVSELFNHEFDEPKDTAKLKLVRAYEITPLINTTFTISHENELPAVLAHLIESKIPNVIKYEINNSWRLQFRKYLIIHDSLAAPIDTLTKQPMAIELCGRVIEINGIDLDSEAGDQWWFKNKTTNDSLNEEKIGNMVIKIQAATYANVMHPGVNVPFYL